MILGCESIVPDPVTQQEYQLKKAKVKEEKVTIIDFKNGKVVFISTPQSQLEARLNREEFYSFSPLGIYIFTDKEGIRFKTADVFITSFNKTTFLGTVASPSGGPYEELLSIKASQLTDGYFEGWIRDPYLLDEDPKKIKIGLVTNREGGISEIKFPSYTFEIIFLRTFSK